MTDLAGRDCIVVGGGLLGMLTAYFLRSEGLSVTLLDQGGVCRESSWAGGGILSPLVPWEYPDAVSELARWSQRHYPGLAVELRERSGIDPEWQQSGLLMAGISLEPRINRWQARYACRVEQLDPGQVHQLEPGLAPFTEQALLLPDVAQIRNPRLCQSLAASLRSQGVVIREQVQVGGLRIAGNTISGVMTDHGALVADRVVVAAGAWSAALLGDLTPDLPVSPVRGQMIQYAASPDLLRHIVLFNGRYLIPRRDGLLLAGSTLEYTGFNKQTTREARDSLAGFARRLLPGLSECEIVNHWAGLRPGKPDGIPIIGEHREIKGLYINTGHFRNGVILGPASARLLVDIMLDRPSFTTPDAYGVP
ncbi:MAG TPA: glycine oxidase ThiO [Gammaproteobacteria bacterium]|nr:glycine oxidase ThiO [Gammaproteobacteria bacterium]